MPQKFLLITTTLLPFAFAPLAHSGLPPAQLLPKYQPSSQQQSPVAAQAQTAKAEIHSLQIQNAQLEEQIKLLNRRLNEVVQIQVQAQQVNVSAETLTKLQSENNSLRKSIQQLNEHVARLQTQSLQSGQPETQQLAQDQQKQIQFLQHHNKVLQKQLSDVEARLTGMQTRTKYGPTPNQIKQGDFDQKIKTLERDNQQLNTHFQALTMRLNEMRPNEKQAQAETVAFNETQEQVLSQLNAQVNSLQQEIKRLNGQIEVLSHKINTLEQGQKPEQTIAASDASAPTTSASLATVSQTAPKEARSLPSGQPVEAYNQALSFLNKRQFDLAQKALQDFTKQFSNSPLIVNAQYWLAETYYIQRNFQQAALEFSTAYKSYEKHKKANQTSQISVKAPEILLKIALTLIELDNRQDARITLDQLEAEFPSSPDAIKRQIHLARQRLASSRS